MNKVLISGHICNDLELKAVGEHQYVRFAVGITRKNKKEDGTRDSDFPNCVAWDKRAEVIKQYFHKGSPINVVGRLQTGSYEGNDGKKVYTTDIIVEDFDFLEKRSDRPVPEYTDTPTPIPTSESDPFAEMGKQVEAEFTDEEGDELPF